MKSNPDALTANKSSSGAAPVIRFVLKAVIALAILGYLLQGMDLDTVVHLVLSIDPVYLGIATALGLLISLVASVRWYYVILAMGLRLSSYRALQLTMVGTFFNQILPTAMGGDLARIPYAHRSGLPLGSAINSVILDRVTAMTTLVLLVLATLPLALSTLEASQARWLLFMVAACGLAGTFIILGIAHIPGRLLHPLFKPVVTLSLSLREIVAGRYAPAVLISGTVVHLIRVITVYAIAVGMQLDITFSNCLVLVPSALLVTVIPVSIGGWGIREGAFVIAFGFSGLPPEQAFALSVVFGITILIAGLLGAPFWIFFSKQGLPETSR
jgi:uncharacterized membrane protein YbhN (UPF0104 family)